MVSVSLLQRLESEAAPGAPAPDFEDESAVMDSILASLRTILNSKQGCCETRPDYGLTDFNAFGETYQKAVALIARDIENQVRQFEPRLRNVVVRSVQDKSRLLEFVFHIDADLAYDGRKVPVKFNSVLGSDGQMRFNA